MPKDEAHPAASMADLLESAVAAAHPGRVAATRDDCTAYRIPFDRLRGGLSSQGESTHAGQQIDWPPALKAAYEDGYDPLQWVGRGASSEVWRCVDRAFGREVAIKIPCLENEQDAGPAVQALQDEAELLGRLRHPGVVQAVRRSGDGTAAYLAIDFIDGENLVEHCRLLDLDSKARMRLVAKVLDTVAYLHTKGVVHGDLKPDHLLVREDNQPILIDFGLSSYDSSVGLYSVDAKRIGGSANYRAPEIVKGSADAPEPQQDVYSLGVILRETLEGVDLGSMSAAVDLAVSRALLPDPGLRWANAGQMLEALRPLLSTHGRDGAVASDPTLLAPRAPRRVRALRLMTPASVIIAVIIGAVWFFASDPDSRGLLGEPQKKDVDRRSLVQASLFDLTLQDIYAERLPQASERISQLTAQKPDEASTWEMRHLNAMAQGNGELYPLGKSPYNTAHALCVDYDPASDTVAYIKVWQGNYQLWVRPLNGAARLIGQSDELISSIAISSGADQLATIDANGEVVVWTIRRSGAAVIHKRELPRRIGDRIAWFSSDGESICLFSPKMRALECWSVEVGSPAKRLFTIGECDHAYRLPSGAGAFMVATAGAKTQTGKTQLRVIDARGQVTRNMTLLDGQLPTSADCGPAQTDTVCLGMPDGYVRIHETGKGGWQPPCDLGRNAPVPAIVYSESQSRVYASLDRIHVIDPAGGLVMRLGDRDDKAQLVTRLEFNETTASLTCLSARTFWRCTTQ